MKAFKRVFLAAALLSSVPALTLLAPSGHAQTPSQWHVLVTDPTGNYLFIEVANVGTRTEANTLVERYRDCGQTGVHAVPDQAYQAQVTARIVNPSPQSITCP